jgi:hypothetical protein
MFLISVFMLRGFGQEFLSGGIVKYNAKTNTIVKEIDLRLIMGNLVQADDGLFYGLVHSDSSNQMMLFSYDHLTKEYVGKNLLTPYFLFTIILASLKATTGCYTDTHAVEARIMRGFSSVLIHLHRLVTNALILVRMHLKIQHSVTLRKERMICFMDLAMVGGNTGH